MAVLVSDVNDNRPMLQSVSRTRTLSESLPAGTVILNLVATDADFGNNSLIMYVILSEQSAANGVSNGGEQKKSLLIGPFDHIISQLIYFLFFFIIG